MGTNRDSHAAISAASDQASHANSGTAEMSPTMRQRYDSVLICHSSTAAMKRVIAMGLHMTGSAKSLGLVSVNLKSEPLILIGLD